MAFLVFEGIDGAGKSTLISSLQQRLLEQKQEVVITREPGGTPLGEALRQLLLKTDGDIPVPRAELLLYEAIRAQHVERVIKPALQKKQWILCDRYTSSTLAFQAGGRELDSQPIQWLNFFATDGVEPNLFILLDLPPTEGQNRMQAREKDRFEIEELSFHERVRNYYLKLASEKPNQWLVLNALQSPQSLFEQLLHHLEKQSW
ncbi:MAG: dTMP kinase [Bdellovibrionaceae bacterium]|nr:dTMP kinase [Pseudobdellovibrionaceae bacterium]